MTHIAELVAKAVVADGQDGRPDSFVQWKGTDLCMDFTCVCGVRGHVDEDFCYVVQCPACDRRYELAPTVLVREIPTDEDAAGDPKVLQIS